MNELRIHTIADLQLHVRHRGKVPIRGFDRIYAMALQALPGNPPSSFEERRKARKIRISFEIWRGMGGETEVFNGNVEIRLHNRPNSFHDG